MLNCKKTDRIMKYGMADEKQLDCNGWLMRSSWLVMRVSVTGREYYMERADYYAIADR
ncbi:hypothetical protein [Paenibacillus tritici]|uniref:hypothetical protein n=1 Tax=Paenibacillus tritici TaxID=1873425 RepID=UPI001566919B|nr:hypothetical protein [Paenibacillus tritici]